MSWPDDNEPRFVVDWISGFRINPGQGISSPSNTRKPNFAAYVYDRAYCHRVVAVFDRWRPSTWPDGVIAAARVCADELNEFDRQAAA